MRNPAQLEAVVEATLREWGVANAQVTVAYSGGLDSSVLLYLLVALRRPLNLEVHALHVHHGLNPAADAWLSHCEQLCRELEVPFRAERVQVECASGNGLEAAARKARYAAFARCGSRWLALAHHQDDQGETVLHRLLRGGGVAGAAAMPPQRPLERTAPDGTTVIRPLLERSRAELEEYAYSRAVAWITDDSNADSALRRNFLRHEIFPLLRKQYGAPARNLARAARHFADTQQLLDELADEDLTLCASEGRLVISCLAALSEARARNLLRRHLGRLGLPAPDEAALAEALRQSLTARDDGQVAVALGGATLRRYRGELFLLAAEPSAPPSLPWRGEEVLDWAGGQIEFIQTLGMGLSVSRLTGGALAIIRTRVGGERLQLRPGQARRSLKNLFQERGIPPWWRGVLPLLWCGDQLVWVAGIGGAAGWQCLPGEEGVRLRWQPSALPGQQLGEFDR